MQLMFLKGGNIAIIRGYLGRRPTLACLWDAKPKGVRGHAPPLGNFENAYSWRCILIDFVGKIKGIQDRLFSGNR